MARWVTEDGDHASVPRQLCERLYELTASGADQETRDAARELRSCWPTRWESDLSRTRSTAADAAVLEQDSSTNPQHN
jgi:hypothetical protein